MKATKLHSNARLLVTPNGAISSRSVGRRKCEYAASIMPKNQRGICSRNTMGEGGGLFRFEGGGLGNEVFAMDTVDFLRCFFQLYFYRWIRSVPFDGSFTDGGVVMVLDELGF